MKEIKQAIVLVDAFRPPSRERNTAGRYRVGAKTEKETVKLVQKAIGFGSVQFYYWERETLPEKKAAYKQVLRDIPLTRLADTGYEQTKARHACSPLNKEG